MRARLRSANLRRSMTARTTFSGSSTAPFTGQGSAVMAASNASHPASDWKDAFSYSLNGSP